MLLDTMEGKICDGLMLLTDRAKEAFRPALINECRLTSLEIDENWDQDYSRYVVTFKGKLVESWPRINTELDARLSNKK